MGQGIARPAKQIFGFIQIEPQGNCQRNGSLFAGIIAAFADFGKQLAVQICPFVYFHISHAFFINQPEQLVIRDGKAYVANSGGFYANSGVIGAKYDNTVSVVDLKSMKVEYDIEVAVNLELMLVDAEGTIWVSSRGNYSDVSSTLNYLVKKNLHMKTSEPAVLHMYM